MSTTGDSAPQISGTAESAKECADWQALLERIPYAQHLGLEVQRGDAGVLVHLPCREALIVAAQSQDAETRCPRILDSHINYLRSAKARSTFARADIIRQGRRTSLVQVTCWQGDDKKPIATGQVQLLLPTMAAQQEDRHGH
jgi:hypothetical protein